MSRYLPIAILIVSLLFSCKSEKSSDKEAINQLPEYIDDGREKHASIDFVDDFIDIGTIKDGEVVMQTFHFQNNGNIPLVINDVVASCGCTTTNLSKRVLNPTDNATIQVVFDSKGWFGAQYKSITIVSNATTPRRSITIRANVVQ
jgi:hypothetical protein